MSPISHAGHRFPPVVIRRAVWPYPRFTPSHRDAEDPPAGRGLDVSYESIRRRGQTFGPAVARRLRRHRPEPTAHRQPDEMAARIAGQRLCLRRAIDDEGEVLGVLVRRGRNGAAARTLTRKRPKRRGFAPAGIVADGPGPHPVAPRPPGPMATHDRGRRADDRAETPRRPARRREHGRRKSKSPGSAQRFLSGHTAADTAVHRRRPPPGRGRHKPLRAGSFEARADAAIAARTEHRTPAVCPRRANATMPYRHTQFCVPDSAFLRS